MYHSPTRGWGWLSAAVVCSADAPLDKQWEQRTKAQSQLAFSFLSFLPADPTSCFSKGFPDRQLISYLVTARLPSWVSQCCWPCTLQAPRLQCALCPFPDLPRWHSPPPTLNRESVPPTAHSPQSSASETDMHALGTWVTAFTHLKLLLEWLCTPCTPASRILQARAPGAANHTLLCPRCHLDDHEVVAWKGWMLPRKQVGLVQISPPPSASINHVSGTCA